MEIELNENTIKSSEDVFNIVSATAEYYHLLWDNVDDNKAAKIAFSKRYKPPIFVSYSKTGEVLGSVFVLMNGYGVKADPISVKFDNGVTLETTQIFYSKYYTRAVGIDANLIYEFYDIENHDEPIDILVIKRENLNTTISAQIFSTFLETGLLTPKWKLIKITDALEDKEYKKQLKFYSKLIDDDAFKQLIIDITTARKISVYEIISNPFSALDSNDIVLSVHDAILNRDLLLVPNLDNYLLLAYAIEIPGIVDEGMVISPIYAFPEKAIEYKYKYVFKELYGRYFFDSAPLRLQPAKAGNFDYVTIFINNLYNPVLLVYRVY